MAAGLIPVDDVVATLLEKAIPTVAVESIQIAAAQGRILATDLYATANVPPFANSAMDGYAVASADVVDSGIYEVSQRIAAGATGSPLRKGTIARIFTGAPMPSGSDAIVIQEDTEDMDGKIRIVVRPRIGENVRPSGQDIKQGATVLYQGQRLTPQDLSLAASVGYAQLPVYRKLTVAILATGDELVEPPAELKPGQIYNSNRHALAGMLTNLGMEVLDLGTVADSLATTREALIDAAERSDCIFTTGGVSVGEEDHVRAAVLSLGRLDLWRVAIKPGKPLAFGSVNGTPFFGLPGNPVSTYVTFRVIAVPFLRKLQGAVDLIDDRQVGAATFSFEGGSRREYLRVRARLEGLTNKLELYPNQGSAVMSGVVWANALAEVEVNQKVRPGDKLRYLPIR